MCMNSMDLKRPILSISLLSSGRAGTIEKCLNSLIPLKKAFYTEIIVVDTSDGNNDKVSGILKQYADKVIPFKWCNDFSAARNKGLQAISGEWFLYIDDDEYFIDSKPLIDFLLSEEKDKFGWANLVRRDFRDSDLTIYTDAWLSRLFHVTDDIRFVGRIHEYISPVCGAPCNIDALIGHTGYIFKTTEQKIAHAKRNMDLLEIQIADEPLEVRWVFQAMEECDDLGDRHKELELAQKGYDLMRGGNGHEAKIIRGLFAANIVRLPAMQNDWITTLSAYDEMLSGEEIGDISRAYMEISAACASYNLGDFYDAKEHCRTYLDYYKKYANRPITDPDEYTYFQAGTFLERSYNMMKSMYEEIK